MSCFEDFEHLHKVRCLLSYLSDLDMEGFIAFVTIHDEFSRLAKGETRRNQLMAIADEHFYARLSALKLSNPLHALLEFHDYHKVRG